MDIGIKLSPVMWVFLHSKEPPLFMKYSNGTSMHTVLCIPVSKLVSCDFSIPMLIQRIYLSALLFSTNYVCLHDPFPVASGFTLLWGLRVHSLLLLEAHMLEAGLLGLLSLRSQSVLLTNLIILAKVQRISATAVYHVACVTE